MGSHAPSELDAQLFLDVAGSLPPVSVADARVFPVQGCEGEWIVRRLLQRRDGLALSRQGADAHGEHLQLLENQAAPSFVLGCEGAHVMDEFMIGAGEVIIQNAKQLALTGGKLVHLKAHFLDLLHQCGHRGPPFGVVLANHDLREWQHLFSPEMRRRDGGVVLKVGNVTARTRSAVLVQRRGGAALSYARAAARRHWKASTCSRSAYLSALVVLTWLRRKTFNGRSRRCSASTGSNQLSAP